MEELMECPFCKTHLVHEEGRIKHIDPAGIGCVLDGQVWPDRVVTEWNTRATDPLIKQLKDEVNRLYVKIDEDRFAALADDSVPRLVFNAAIEAIANKDQMLEEIARALEELERLADVAEQFVLSPNSKATFTILKNAVKYTKNYLQKYNTHVNQQSGES